MKCSFRPPLWPALVALACILVLNLQGSERTTAIGERASLDPATEAPVKIEYPPATPASGFQIRAVPSMEWVYHKTDDGAHPNGREQEMLWLMNRARSMPEAEGIFLAGIGQPDITVQYQIWGVDLNKMKAEFAELDSRVPAAFDRRLYEGSLAHSEYMISIDTQTHEGQGQRIVDSGFRVNGARFNVFTLARNALHAHAAFNVDWGLQSFESGEEYIDGMLEGRGHRVGLMGYFEYPIDNYDLNLPNVGIAMVAETNPQTAVGPYVTSVTYARAYPGEPEHHNKFIVGTVWDDDNQDGRYNPGEGKAGVTVMPNSGTYYAVTGDAGGFAIPVTENGDYTLTFSGGALSAPETRVVAVSGSSALVDWRVEDAYDYVTPWVRPKFNYILDGNGLLITWIGEPNYVYHLQSMRTGLSFAADARTISQGGALFSFRVTNSEMLDGILFRLELERTGN